MEIRNQCLGIFILTQSYDDKTFDLVWLSARSTMEFGNEWPNMKYSEPHNTLSLSRRPEPKPGRRSVNRQQAIMHEENEVLNSGGYLSSKCGTASTRHLSQPPSSTPHSHVKPAIEFLSPSEYVINASFIRVTHVCTYCTVPIFFDSKLISQEVDATDAISWIGLARKETRIAQHSRPQIS